MAFNGKERGGEGDKMKCFGRGEGEGERRGERIPLLSTV